MDGLTCRTYPSCKTAPDLLRPPARRANRNGSGSLEIGVLPTSWDSLSISSKSISGYPSPHSNSAGIYTVRKFACVPWYRRPPPPAISEASVVPPPPYPRHLCRAHRSPPDNSVPTTPSLSLPPSRQPPSSLPPASLPLINIKLIDQCNQSI